MTNRSRNSTTRMQTHPHSGRVQRDRISKRGSWMQLLLAIALLLSSAGLVIGGIWLSIQLFFNPNAASWMNQLLPQWAQIPLVRPESDQTLTQIQAKIKQLGQIPGKPLPLETTANSLQPKSLLLPVLNQQPNCLSDCEQIVELRLYQLASVSQPSKVEKDETYYQLVDQMPVEGPDEGWVIAPLVAAGVADPGSDLPLSLTQLHRFAENTSALGIWLYLLGQRMQGVGAIAYGQILHYNPKSSDLSLLLPWTSPTGQVPQWQQVTGGGFPELVIDETVDLEPQFLVYQVKPAPSDFNPIQLEQISLLKPALNNPAYRDALLLARKGLWSPAWKWLQFIQQQHREIWSTSAQAQMDLIELYAQFTQKQAEQTWASPSQQILADLIDGRWGEALQVFQTSSESTQEIVTLLQGDAEQLWDRVEAALQVNPNRPEVQAWGTLILAAQSGTDSAIAWLKQQPKSTASTFDYINSLLRRLEGGFSTTEETNTSPTN